MSRLPPAPYPSGLLPPPAALPRRIPRPDPRCPQRGRCPSPGGPGLPFVAGIASEDGGSFSPAASCALCPAALHRHLSSLPALRSRPGSAAPAGASPVAQPPRPSAGAASAPAPAPSPPGLREMPRVGVGGAGIATAPGERVAPRIVEKLCAYRVKGGVGECEGEGGGKTTTQNCLHEFPSARPASEISPIRAVRGGS